MNKVILLGNVGRDPEIKNTASGMTVLGFSVATKEYSKGEDKTEWHKLKCFGKLAENMQKMLKKGSHVFIEGRLQTSSWEKDGKTNYMTEIVANNIQLLDKKESNKGADYVSNQGGQNEIPF